MFKARSGAASPWIRFSMPTIFSNEDSNRSAQKLFDFTKNAAVALELKILLNSPQAHWPLLLKIILMRKSYLTSIIFSHLIEHLPSADCFKTALSQPFAKDEISAEKCKRFLCGKECKSVAEWACTDEGKIYQLICVRITRAFHSLIDPVGQTNYQVVLALVYVLTSVGKSSDIRSTLVSPLEQSTKRDWPDCLDRRQVWNQKRPPWFEALHHFVYPILNPIINILISSMQSGATIYQVSSSVIYIYLPLFNLYFQKRRWHWLSPV